MMPVYDTMLNQQPIWVFDLHLSNTARSQRRAVLDAILSQFLPTYIAHSSQNRVPPAVWQTLSQFCQIIHRPAQPAQAVFLDDNGEKLTLTLAISYALPYVAVALSPQKIGLDMCAVADFAPMSFSERQQFCQDYFPCEPITREAISLANYWSQLEAKLKYWQMPLSEAMQDIAKFQALPAVAVSSKTITLATQTYWLSMASEG